MIAWWIVPTLLSVLALLCLFWGLVARDLWESAAGIFGFFALGLTSLGMWLLCFLLKVFQ